MPTSEHDSVFSQEGESAEQARFSKGSALHSLCVMSVGPLIYQIGIAFHDALDLFLINKALGSHSLQVVGFSSMMRYLGMSLAIFFGIAMTGRLAKLIGENRREEAEQVVVDLFRLAIPSELVLGIIFYFISKSILKFMGCTEEIAEEGITYLTPILFSLPLISIFQLSVFFIQSEGRSILSGVMQLVAFVLNCGFFGPILLFGFKVSLKWAGLSFALAQILPGLVLFIMIFKGKFGLHPSFSMFAKKFSSETYQAILVGMPFILNVLMGTIPPLLMMKWMMNVAVHAGNPGEVGAVYSVFLKIQVVVNSFGVGFGQGFFFSGSNARGTQNHSRLIQLFLWALVVNFLIQCILYPFLIVIPDKIGSFWITEPAQIELSKTFIKIPFFTTMLVALNLIGINYLMCMQHAYLAMLPCIITGISFIAAGYALSHVYTHDPTKVMYTYNCNDVSVFILVILCSIVPFKRLLHESKAMTDSTPLISNR